MPDPQPKRYGLTDLHSARDTHQPLPVLTCYDYTTAGLLVRAGVPAILVGDSAGMVVLGHATTVPISLEFLIELTAAVRRGAPGVFLIGDMPFGSYADDSAAERVARMVQLSGCDCVKLETGPTHVRLVRRLSDNGMAIMPHLGLRPQSVNVLGGYRARGKTPKEAAAIVTLARRMEQAGACSLLLEAVPPEVSQAVVKSISIPVIGCGAGPACHGHVVVTHDLLGLTQRPPKFVPVLGDIATPTLAAARAYVQLVQSGSYPADEHVYGLADGSRADVIAAMNAAANAPL